MGYWDGGRWSWVGVLGCRLVMLVGVGGSGM